MQMPGCESGSNLFNLSFIHLWNGPDHIDQFYWIGGINKLWHMIYENIQQMLAIIVMENYYSFLKICVWIERNLHVKVQRATEQRFWRCGQWKMKSEPWSLTRMCFERSPTPATKARKVNQARSGASAKAQDPPGCRGHRHLSPSLPFKSLLGPLPPARPPLCF